jgi:hypothetical protein
MASFLYFSTQIPDKAAVATVLKFPHPPELVSSIVGVERGPDETRGHVWTLTEQALHTPHNPTPVGYYPDRQKWVQVGRYWVGWFLADRPAPRDFQRGATCDGHAVRCIDGESWTVGVARKWTGENILPMTFGIEPSGASCMKPHPQHVELWERAEKIWFQMTDKRGQREPEMTWDDCVSTVVMALQLNYRISGDEVRALELFDVTALRDGVRAVCDYPNVMLIGNAALGKKK